MQKRILSIAIITLLFFSFFNSGCSKLDTTDIGSDLLPAVDNVHTFDTLLTINSTQGIFSLDSTQVANSDDQVIGKINNDPLFGTTKADVYAQFKPSFYPYYYGNANDTIVGFDSVVLCLSYKGFWGDSTIPMQLQVKEVSPTAGGIWDSLALIKTVNYSPLTNSSIIGTTTVDFTTLGNYMMYANKKEMSTAFPILSFSSPTVASINLVSTRSTTSLF